MNHLGKFGQITGSALAVVLVFCASSVMAETITSPSYKINGNFGGNFGGQTSSSSYNMTSIGGESIVGNGSSGSYLIDQQDTPTAPSMQLNVQPSGLVGFFPMDENAGTTTADASRYQNNGTLKSTAAWSTPGKLGSAVDINGPIGTSGDGSVNIPDNANLPSGTQMTFEAWVNADDPNSGIFKPIASHWNSGVSESWAVAVAYGRIWVYISSAQIGDGTHSVATSSTAFNVANTWRHVAVVYDGAQEASERVKIYVDGTAATIAGINGTTPSSLQNSSAQFSIGSYNGLYSAFPGSIDHVKLFNRALTADEIRAEYMAQNAGVATGFALGTLTDGSKLSLMDAIVRTNVQGYSLAVQQDHDLQSGANTIPAVSGSIAAPSNWIDDTTKGLGFTLTSAPSLDGKWGSGANYAAVPSSATSFYSGTGHTPNTIDVVGLRLRLDTDSSQAVGGYSNNITYTGTMIP